MCTMSGEINEVIDLTDSFTLIDHHQMADVLIEIDDSIYVFPPDSSLPERRNEERRSNIRNPKTKRTSTSKKCPKRLSSHSPQPDGRTKGLGDCPICWDELGKNPLASTKCGHVFCLHCIQQVVKQTKSCPTCRCPLKKASAYHPIYLSLQ